MHEECLSLVLDRFGLASPFPILLNNSDIQLNKEIFKLPISVTLSEKQGVNSITSQKLQPLSSVEQAQRKEIEEKKLKQASLKLQAVAVVKEEADEDDSEEEGKKKGKNGVNSDPEEQTFDKEGTLLLALALLTRW